MNSKAHLIISLAKSIIRIVCSVITFIVGSLYVMTIGFIVAEVLGICEELFDKR